MARQTTAVTIANNASLSSAVDISDYMLCGLIVPSTWTSADLTFAAAVHPGYGDAAFSTYTYYPMHDATGAELTIVNGANTSRFYTLSPTAFSGVRFLKVRSGTSSAAVNQGGARTILLVIEDS